MDLLSWKWVPRKMLIRLLSSVTAKTWTAAAWLSMKLGRARSALPEISRAAAAVAVAAGSEETVVDTASSVVPAKVAAVEYAMPNARVKARGSAFGHLRHRFSQATRFG